MPKCDFNEIASNFIEIALWQGCSPINLLYIFRTPFPKNTSGGLLLNFRSSGSELFSKKSCSEIFHDINKKIPTFKSLF